MQAPLNDILGYEESAMINGGDVENRGVELALSWNDNIGGDFLYHVNVNAAYNRNRVTRLATASGKIGDDASSTLFENSSYVSLVEVGHPIGYFSGMSHSGIWQTQQQIDDARAAGRPVLPSAQPGDFIWDDYNNDGVISLDGDRHEIGDPNPDWTLGVNLGFSYKGFDFSAAGSGISECRQCSAIARLFLPTRISTTQPTFLIVGMEPAQATLCPVSLSEARTTSGCLPTTCRTATTSKLQNITIGYDFASQFKTPFQQLRLYCQLQNLCTITKYTGVDPEIGSNGGTDNNWIRGIDTGLYPSARSVVLGVTVKF